MLLAFAGAGVIRFWERCGSRPLAALVGRFAMRCQVAVRPGPLRGRTAFFLSLMKPAISIYCSRLASAHFVVSHRPYDRRPICTIVVLWSTSRTDTALRAQRSTTAISPCRGHGRCRVRARAERVSPTEGTLSTKNYRNPNVSFFYDSVIRQYFTFFLIASDILGQAVQKKMVVPFLQHRQCRMALCDACNLFSNAHIHSCGSETAHFTNEHIFSSVVCVQKLPKRLPVIGSAN